MNKVKFKDKVFKKAIKELFNLDDNMTLEDLKKIDEIEFYESTTETRYVNLKGKIKSLEDLKYFPNLKKLCLNFSDPDKPEIYGNLKDIVHLTKLEELNMSGSIIKGNLSELNPLKKLHTLILTGVNIKGELKELTNLEKLKKINLCDGKFKGTIKDLHKLSSLEAIILGWTNIKGNLSDLKIFKNLKVIDFNCCENIKGDTEDLKGLKKLVDISLAECSISGDISVLKEHKELKTLDLSFCENITGNLKYLKNFKYLEDFYFDNSNVKGSLKDISNLENLKCIAIRNTYISGSLKHLKKLENLEEISASSSEIIGDIKDISHLKKLKYLYINHTKIKGNEEDLNLLPLLKEFEFKGTLIKKNIKEKQKEEKMEKKEIKKYRYKLFDFQILEEFRNNIGNFSARLNDASPEELNVDIHLSKPTEDRDYYIVMTEGMGAYPMKMPNGNTVRAELVLYLPSDWDFENLSNKECSWPFDVLKFLSYFPLKNDSYIGNFHTIGDGYVFSPNNDFRSLEILNYVDLEKESFKELLKYVGKEQTEYEEKVIELSDGEKLKIYTVVPLFKEEIMYKIKHGGYSLFKEMKNIQSLKDFVIINPKRQNTFINDKITDFEKYKDTRIELEDPERIIKFEDKGLEKGIRQLYGLEGEIRHKDIGYRESLNFVEFVRNGFVDIYTTDNKEEKVKIESFKDLKWFVNLIELGLCYGDPGYPFIFGDLKDLLHLKRLVSLNTSGAIVQGKLSDLKVLPNLKELTLTGQGIKGKLDDLKHFKDIESLYICDTRVTGDLKDIGYLTKLKALTLAINKIGGDISDLKVFKNLEDLSIGDTKIKGNIKDLSELKNLKYIAIDDSSISGTLKSLKNLENLEEIIAYSSKITGNLKDIKHLKKLRDIDIYNTKVKGDLKDLELLPLLRSVDISESLVETTPEDLEKLEKIARITSNLKENDNNEEDDDKEIPYIDTYYLKLDNEIRYFDMILDDTENYFVYEGVVGKEFVGEEIECSLDELNKMIEKKKAQGYKNYELEEMIVVLKDYPRVNPSSLVDNIADYLNYLTIGVVEKYLVEDESLKIKCSFIDIELAKKLLSKEFKGYDISFE